MSSGNDFVAGRFHRASKLWRIPVWCSLVTISRFWGESNPYSLCLLPCFPYFPCCTIKTFHPNSISVSFHLGLVVCRTSKTRPSLSQESERQRCICFDALNLFLFGKFFWPPNIFKRVHRCEFQRWWFLEFSQCSKEMISLWSLPLRELMQNYNEKVQKTVQGLPVVQKSSANYPCRGGNLTKRLKIVVSPPGIAFLPEEFFYPEYARWNMANLLKCAVDSQTSACALNPLVQAVPTPLRGESRGLPVAQGLPWVCHFFCIFYQWIIHCRKKTNSSPKYSCRGI